MAYTAKADGAWLDKTDGGGTALSNLIDKGDANRWEANQLDAHTRLTALEASTAATTVNIQTGTTYTFVLGDANTVIVRAGNAGSQTYTIPPNSSVAYPVGTSLTVLRYGAGALSLVQGSGVTLRPSSPQVARAQYSLVTALQIAANEWIIGGDVQ